MNLETLCFDISLRAKIPSNVSKDLWALKMNKNLKINGIEG